MTYQEARKISEPSCYTDTPVEARRHAWPDSHMGILWDFPTPEDRRATDWYIVGTDGNKIETVPVDGKRMDLKEAYSYLRVAKNFTDSEAMEEIHKLKLA